MKIVLRAVVAVFLMFVCTSSDLRADKYSELKTGKLKGKLIVQWLEPDVFLFLPDSKDPLTFTRATGSTIVPGRMLTDGGSIPRPFRVFRNYSPWGYAPAFIVHDWLFHMKHCQIGSYKDYDLAEAGNVMAEIIKTMMETGKVEKDGFTVDLMYAAVSSSIAQKYWDEGRCEPAPPNFSEHPLYQFTIEFP
jgi:hypothetical protein